MRCPYCTNFETKVVDSRLNQIGDITRRRRECQRCEGRFTTYERVEEVMPSVIKKDGRREPYCREKVESGIHKACQKLPVTAEQMETMISAVERKVQSFGLKEVPAQTIGKMIMAMLHKVNKVAYVRFASVYREFKDVDEFVAELQEDPLLGGDHEDEASSLSFSFLEEKENRSPSGKPQKA